MGIHSGVLEKMMRLVETIHMTQMINGRKLLMLLLFLRVLDGTVPGVAFISLLPSEPIAPVPQLNIPFSSQHMNLSQMDHGSLVIVGAL